MTFDNMLNKMKGMNSLYPGRFMYNNERGVLKYGHITPVIVECNENNFESVFKELLDEEWFTINESCEPINLYNKVYWSDLSDSQKDSIRDYWKELECVSAQFIDDEEYQELLFNSNRSFLEYV